jgi:hypothetical protein
VRQKEVQVASLSAHQAARLHIVGKIDCFAQSMRLPYARSFMIGRTDGRRSALA